jgi:membrane protein
VLFGLEIVFAHQHYWHLSAVATNSGFSTTTHEELALATLIQINLNFQNSNTPLSAQKLADKLDVPLLLFETVLFELESLKYVAETSGNSSAWLPARDPSEIMVIEVIGSLRGISSLQPTIPVIKRAEELLCKAWDGSKDSLNGVTLRDLLKNI